MALWSDGIHFVRAANKTVDHPMPWYAGAHNLTGSTFKRYAPTMDDALTLAISATKRWLKAHPADQPYHKVTALPSASALQGIKKQRGRPPKPKVEGFSTYHFTCIAANPYAQVWQCTSYPGEKKAVGRKKANGRAPDETAFRHKKGECSVLLGEEPVRGADGTIHVFPNWRDAYFHALELYQNAPGDEVISWSEDDIVVSRTQHFNIEFNPALNGENKPFTLWNVTYSKPVYLDKTKPAITADDQATRSLRQMQDTNPELYLQIMDQRSKARSLDRVPAFSDEPLKFRSIWQAIQEAERREKMMQGIPV
jgi:hypothetical protein